MDHGHTIVGLVPPAAKGDDIDLFRAQRATQTPGIDTEAMAIFGRIYRIAARLAPHMEALFARHGLERGEFDVLATLERGGPPYRLSPTELYRSLMVSSGGLTYRLKRLEATGLVRRCPSPDDGRSLMVELTAEGKRRATAAFEEDMQVQGVWLSAMPGEHRRILADLLRQLNSALPAGPGKNHAPP